MKITDHLHGHQNIQLKNIYYMKDRFPDTLKDVISLTLSSYLNIYFE